MSLLERGNNDSRILQYALEQIPARSIFTTVITYEEQMRGWLARASQANTTEKLIAAYTRLQTHIRTFEQIPVLGFDASAGIIFDKLKAARIRVGVMDLKIASIALANNATLLSRNTSDFSKIPELRVEDWSQ